MCKLNNWFRPEALLASTYRPFTELLVISYKRLLITILTESVTNAIYTNSQVLQSLTHWSVLTSRSVYRAEHNRTLPNFERRKRAELITLIVVLYIQRLKNTQLIVNCKRFCSFTTLTSEKGERLNSPTVGKWIIISKATTQYPGLKKENIKNLKPQRESILIMQSTVMPGTRTNILTRIPWHCKIGENILRAQRSSSSWEFVQQVELLVYVWSVGHTKKIC